MDSISSWLENIDFSTIVSEQDVRSKIAIPLLSYLGYDNSIQANEFPIFSFSGRTKNSAKLVDLLCFSSKDWINHKKFESRNWVKQNALLSFELKKPSEKLDDAEGQAEFYSMNARTPFYMCTNGQQLKIFGMKEFSADTVIFDGMIENLAEKWVLIYNKISFKSLLPLKKVDDERNEKIYLDYCVSLKNQYEDIYSWYWEQKPLIVQTGRKIELENIIETNKNVTLIGKAGTGKTTFLHRMFIKICEEYLEGTNEKIPIFLSAKLWKRDFSTLIEGIFSELRIFLPQLTIEMLENEIACKKIVLLVDGIDECFVDRDILLNEVNNFPCRTILSTRENNEIGRVSEFCYYELQKLSDNELIDISNDVLNKNTNTIIYNMNSELKNLLKTPIYFNMWLTYNINENGKQLNQTINIAQLYQSFTSYLLKSHIRSKGNFEVENIPMSSLQAILSKFAYELYELKTPDIVNSIKEIYPSSIQNIYKILIQSGLIFETSDLCEFQQHSLKEYYYANHLLNNDKLLEGFLIEKYCLQKYEEIFMILVGLTKDIKKQGYILDFLLEKNLSLFVKCLYRRFDFSDELEKNKSKSFYEEFFETIATNYNRIIDLYFSDLRKFFSPFCWMEDYSKDVGIHFECSVDVNTNSVGLQISVSKDKRVSIAISYSNKSPQILTKNNNESIEIPFSNLKGSMGYFHYNLSNMGKGIDYAREIAIDMIYYNVESILKEKRLLEIESPIMQLIFVEKWLKEASPLQIKFDSEVKKYNLSLKKQSVDELLSLLGGIFTYTIHSRRNQGKNCTFGLLWCLLYINRDYKIDFEKVLFPDRLSEPIGKKQWVWNYYSDEDIVEWIRNYYFFGQSTYREFVDNLLPNLKNDLSYYQTGPIQHNIEVELPDRNGDSYLAEGGLSISSHLVNSIQDSEPIISVTDSSRTRENFESNYEIMKKESIFFNRKLTYYGVSSCTLTYIFKNDNNIREFVYKQLQEDFEKIFKQKNI